MPDQTVEPAARSLLATPLCRSASGLELRAASDGSPAQMTGHFAVFNRWTTINSAFEGHFRERIAPGAFKKTFAEQRDRIRVLFQHGKDPQVGSKPIGQITDLREDETGAFYSVDLYEDAAYVRDLLPALRGNQLGASFQFIATREDWNEYPEPSEDNPLGIPERTILEARVMEFGPVTFGAYPEATSGLRSLTDDYLVHSLGGPAELRSLADKLEERAAAPVAESDAQTAARERLDRAIENRRHAESGDELRAALDAVAEFDDAWAKATERFVAMGDELARVYADTATSGPERAEDTPSAPSEPAAAPGHRTDSERRDDKATPAPIRARRFTTARKEQPHG